MKSAREEMVADLCHKIWCDWMVYVFSECLVDMKDGTMIIPAWAVKKWNRQLQTHYLDLSDEEQESDRIEARKFIELWRMIGG